MRTLILVQDRVLQTCRSYRSLGILHTSLL
jgi:hypothetical protein